MNNVIDFEEEKLNKELSDKLSEYEQFIPTEQELSDTIDEYCQRKGFNQDTTSNDYLVRLEALLLSAFESLCQSFREYDPGNELSYKRFRKMLKDYDTVNAMFNEYLTEKYDMLDDKIESIEKLLASVDGNYEDLSAEQLKSEMKEYIVVIHMIYKEMFELLKQENEKCNSLAYYSLRLMPISYYSFQHYLNKTKDQG